MLEIENPVAVGGVDVAQSNENVVLPNLKEINELAERLDFFDVVILKKFYLGGKDALASTRPYCFPILFREMKNLHKMKIGVEALRKRLKVLTEIGLLVKVNCSNPTNYLPVPEREVFIKAVVTKFFLINGVTKFI